MTTGYITAYANGDQLSTILPVLAAVDPWLFAYTENENAPMGEYAVHLHDIRGTELSDLLNWLGEFAHGRLFCPTYELRWGVDGVQVIIEHELPLPAGGVTEAFECLPEVDIHLWGEPLSRSNLPHYPPLSTVPDVWVETRIPRPLLYPAVSPDHRVKIRAMHYCRRSQVVLTRWLNLENVHEQ